MDIDIPVIICISKQKKPIHLNLHWFISELDDLRNYQAQHLALCRLVIRIWILNLCLNDCLYLFKLLRTNQYFKKSSQPSIQCSIMNSMNLFIHEWNFQVRSIILSKNVSSTTFLLHILMLRYLRIFSGYFYYSFKFLQKKFLKLKEFIDY